MSEKTPPTPEDTHLAAVRAILLRDAQQKIERLEAKIEYLTSQSRTDQDQIRRLLEELAALKQGIRGAVVDGLTLRQDLDRLQESPLADPAKFMDHLAPVMPSLVTRTVREAPEQLAEALGPVMGEAMRVQVREGREEMVEALTPIIGSTVQRALSEFAREIQRNIDARWKSAFGLRQFIRSLQARLSGVSEAELALRDALPFSVRELFLIQRDSGLLLAHSSLDQGQASDTDLISAMLTAIRDFSRDAFDQGAELDEIQYGDARIILVSGKFVYLAVVIDGIELSGFRARLHEFVDDLHARFGAAFKTYDGRPENLPNIGPRLVQLIEDSKPKPNDLPTLTRTQRRVLFLGGLLLISLIGLGCFYLRFTLALLPVAFPGPSLTPTATITLTSTQTMTPIPPTIPATWTMIPSHTASLVPSPSITNSPIPSLTATSTPFWATLVGNTWVFESPQVGARTNQVVLAGTSVIVLAVSGEWAKIEWINERGVQQGWIYLRWLTLQATIPANVVTPTATR